MADEKPAAENKPAPAENKAVAAAANAVNQALAAGPVATGLTDDEKLWGMLGHLLVLAGFIGIPFGNILGPLVAWLVKKDQSKFVAFHALQSLVFQIALFVACIILAIPIIIVVMLTGGLAMIIVWPLALLIGLGMLIYVILMGVKANKGEFNKYIFVGDMIYKKVYGEQAAP
jgi:uncharacterized Tic20 family protein